MILQLGLKSKIILLSHTDVTTNMIINTITLNQTYIGLNKINIEVSMITTTLKKRKIKQVTLTLPLSYSFRRSKLKDILKSSLTKELSLILEINENYFLQLKYLSLNMIIPLSHLPPLKKKLKGIHKVNIQPLTYNI